MKIACLVHTCLNGTNDFQKAEKASFEVQGHVDCFDIQGIVMAEWVPSGQMVNQQYYIEVLTKLHEHVRRKQLELWRNGWILHQDNTPAHNALSVKQFLVNKNITVFEHPPYSPGLAPCYFYLFPKIKSVLKGTHFVLVENVKKQRRPSTALKNMTCGIALNIGSIVCSCKSTRKGTILKAIVVDFLNLLNRKSYRHNLVFFFCQTSYSSTANWQIKIPAIFQAMFGIFSSPSKLLFTPQFLMESLRMSWLGNYPKPSSGPSPESILCHLSPFF